MNGKSPLNYVGWQVGITYQTATKEGLNRQYLEKLLLEMKDNGMNYISFMMNGPGNNDPIHDGYAWPVQHTKARCYKDNNCLNAQPDHEFLSDIIEQAANLNFHVDLMMNGFWWNPEKTKLGYPGIRSTDSGANDYYYHHCSDNDQVWALAVDEVKDLLQYYNSKSVKSYTFEMRGQDSGCKCIDTRNKFKEALTNANIPNYETMKQENNLFYLWKNMRHRQVFQEYVTAIKTIRSDINVCHHGFYEFKGIFSASNYKNSGIAFNIPVIHLITTEDRLKSVLLSSEDFPLVLHVDTRGTPTKNYAVPLKTPKDILNMGEWIEKNNRKNLIGVVFFNEVATSKENRQAVYDVLKIWRKNELLW